MTATTSLAVASGAPALPVWRSASPNGQHDILGRQLWSFAGDDDRKNVNQTLIDPFVNYNLSKGWRLLTAIWS
jgi:hypothetical protein